MGSLQPPTQLPSHPLLGSRVFQTVILGMMSVVLLCLNLLRGSLVKAEWKPNEGLVELKSPAVSNVIAIG